jgi:hypothetical protein
MVSYWTIKHWKSISRSHIIHPGGALVSDECWFSKGGRVSVICILVKDRILTYMNFSCDGVHYFMLESSSLEEDWSTRGTQLNLGYWSRFCAVIGSHPSIHGAMINWRYLLERNFSSVKAVSSNYTHMYKFSLRQRRVGLGAIAGQKKTKKINIGNGFYVVSRVSPLMFCNQCHVASDVLQPMSCSLWCSATNVV